MSEAHTLNQQTLPLVSKPPVESFFSMEHAHAAWPKRITARADFQKQIADQQSLLHAIQTVCTALPFGTTLAQAVDTQLVTHTVATDLLNRLSAYVHTGGAYGRIIFYLPMELTSPIVTTDAALLEASNCFQQSYRRAWEHLALQHDVRANFVDGDVLEIEKRTQDPVRVVKATHLIPGLIQSGHMTFGDVLQYAADTDDMLFTKGVYEASAVLLDLKLITKGEVALLSQSSSLQEHYHRLMQLDFSKAPEESVSEASILATLDAAVMEVQSLELPGITPNRKKWLQEVAFEEAISQAGAKLSTIIQTVATFPTPSGTPCVTLRAYVDAVRRCTLQAQTLTLQHRQWLQAVTNHTSNKALLDSVTKLYLHANTAGILSAEILQEEQIRTPVLQGPFSKNLENFTPRVSEFETMAAQIAEDVYLSDLVYPVVILLGSQLKGYGISNADADAAVFVRPGVVKSDLPELAERLKKIFAHERIGGSAIMFWLEKSVGLLVVRENTQTTDAPPLPTWTHVLMGGAWVGERNDIQLLQHALLTPYLFNPTEVHEGKPVRERWLEEMERDSILYRLLHKGFARYYPAQSPMDTVHGAAIDGTTAFYDPQFRRIATELFLTRVFFPNLG